MTLTTARQFILFSTDPKISYWWDCGDDLGLELPALSLYRDGVNITPIEIRNLKHII